MYSSEIILIFLDMIYTIYKILIKVFLLKCILLILSILSIFYHLFSKQSGDSRLLQRKGKRKGKLIKPFNTGVYDQFFIVID